MVKVVLFVLIILALEPSRIRCVCTLSGLLVPILSGNSRIAHHLLTRETVSHTPAIYRYLLGTAPFFS
jgi:hypothetical protein